MKRRKKRKLKKRFNVILVFILVIVLISILRYLYIGKREYIATIEYKDNKLIINLNTNNSYCIMSNTKPNIDDEKWIKAEDKKCIIDYEQGDTHLYIKINNKIINSSEDSILYLNTSNKKTIYLALGEKYNYINVLVGDYNKLNITNSDEKIANIDNGIITALEKGKTTINIKNENIDEKIEVVVTDLITKVPEEFDHNKKVLGCGVFTAEENNLLDEILKDRINDAEYNTRAAAVEAARFLTLEFPYKISYAYENGRTTTNGIDGEGRYYHIGLYLSEEKYSQITKSRTSPKMWGCSIYSTGIKQNQSNGLDCSGFVSWALLNAGFDIGDVGAGFRSGEYNDLTDYGDLKKLTTSVIEKENIKVGDLLHSEHAGGHIAMIVGIENNNYYVAQALWNYAPSSLTKRTVNSHYVQITKYTSSEIVNVFNEVILMDKYYKKDGNLTNMWY